MPLNTQIQNGDNALITEERMKATFSTDDMAKEIHGEQFSDRRRITEIIKRDSRLHDPVPHAFQTREERIEETARKLSILLSSPELPKPSEDCFFHVVNEVLGIEGHQMGLHTVMFMPTLAGQAHDELLRVIYPRAKRGEIIGTYAQTEMGHGTNLRALETTATYNKMTKEFVLNSPTTTSYKWWPGNLGKSANYTVVVAQLCIEGKNYGPHTFLVQLRDENTHMPLKGITIGDIGPKMAYNTADNGFLKFDHFRIPRNNMLMKHAKVSPDGKYEKPIHPKIAYGGMVHVRAYMIRAQAHFLAMASMIATRYSCIRKQGEITPGAGEVKIIEYQTQQHRLFPQIARTYAYFFCGQEVIRMYRKNQEQLNVGNADLMADLHAVSSGLKAVVSYEVGKGIEQCRMACGGHGYLAASRFSEIFGVAIGGCTYEGENMVMLLQLARYLMKAAKQSRNGSHISPLTEYLAEKETKSDIGSGSGHDHTSYIKAFEHIARRQVLSAYDRLNALKKQGLSDENAWQANAVELNRASRAHTRLFIAKAFCTKVHNISNTKPGLKTVLFELLDLYLNYELLDMSHYLLADQYITPAQLTKIKDDVYLNLAKLKNNAVSLVDSFDISDNELRSVLGRRDGDVYENMLKWAKANPLNKNDVLPSFQKYMQPLMGNAKETSKL